MKRYTVLPLALLLGCPSIDEPTACTEEARASVMVIVEDPDGNPLPDATVVYTIGNGDEPCELSDEATATFVCGYEVEGDMVITASADGYPEVSTEVAVELTADGCHVDTLEATITLEPDQIECTDIAVTSVEVELTGEIEDGAVPLAGATVSFVVDGGAPEPCEEDSTAIGLYFCGIEQVGTFEITASAEGYATGSVTVDVELDEDECHPLTESTFLNLIPAE